MTKCNIGIHSWIYGDFKKVATNWVDDEGNFTRQTLSKAPQKRKCTRCGRIYILVNWNHNHYGKLKSKWRRVQ